MDRLQAMQVFSRVVEAGSFTRAADLMHMPKATVTNLIKGLEGHLGTRLLNRTTRKVSVTADGAAYYERCVRILAEVEETESTLSRAKASPRGLLRVDVPVTFGRHFLVPALPEFFAQYPDIHLKLGCSDRPVDLMEEGVDCVVRGGDQPDASLVARRVGSIDFITCAAPEYLRSHGIPVHPEDLRRHHCINYFSAKTGQIFPWDFTRDGQRVELMLEGPLALNDGEAYLEAGISGLGVIQTTPFFLARAGAALARVLPDWKSDPLPIWILYPQNRHLSTKVRVFVDWLADLFAARHRALLSGGEA